MTFQAALIPVLMFAGFVGNVFAVVVGLFVWERWLKPRLWPAYQVVSAARESPSRSANASG
jgi:hypothetical protein